MLFWAQNRRLQSLLFDVLNHEKRIDRLITAFSMIADKYPDWHVDIFGDGNEKDNYHKCSISTLLPRQSRLFFWGGGINTTMIFSR